MNDIEYIKDLFPSYSLEVHESFLAFFQLIKKYNLKINLVAKSTIESAGIKHFSDSVQGLDLIREHLVQDEPILDFGSGNGFPGILAGILYPQRAIVLVERDLRKAEFLKVAAAELNLSSVEIYGGSVNDLQEKSCVNIISRAMAPLPKFLLEARPVMPTGGKAFLFKGDHWSSEFTAIPAQLFEHFEVTLLGSYELPESSGDRYIVQCLKL